MDGLLRSKLLLPSFISRESRPQAGTRHQLTWSLSGHRLRLLKQSLQVPIHLIRRLDMGPMAGIDRLDGDCGGVLASGRLNDGGKGDGILGSSDQEYRLGDTVLG